MRNILTVVLKSIGAITVPSTVFDLAANIAMKDHHIVKSNPLYETIREFPEDHTSKATFEIGKWGSSG